MYFVTAYNSARVYFWPQDKLLLRNIKIYVLYHYCECADLTTIVINICVLDMTFYYIFRIINLLCKKLVWTLD